MNGTLLFFFKFLYQYILIILSFIMTFSYVLIYFEHVLIISLLSLSHDNLSTVHCHKSSGRDEDKGVLLGPVLCRSAHLITSADILDARAISYL